ncbi:hypothetical protein Hypma_012541 [Hypsizygus marmoreus]|uniref:F-box domain-containing protein n=1 Tax=Hypsizygus marmoreus TaxID=39966 RepID=A0A369JE26_HYPMA|nr:hypothetical protein Hypma_012541 [Hypsizygus marmoreus]
MPNLLLDLPPELVVRILCYLHLPDVLSCTRTHSSLLALTKDFVVLQYHMATQTAMVADNPHCNLPISERFDMLKRREEGWKKFRVDFRKTIPVKHVPSGIYEMTGGIFLLGDTTRKALHYLTLPSKATDEPSWSRIDIDSTMVDIGLSIYEHDLVAVVTTTPQQDCDKIEIQLLQFSSGQPHPLAHTPKIHVADSSWGPRPAIGIEIVGDHLALITNYFLNAMQPDDDFYVYEWKTGTLKLHITAPNHTYSSLVFLSPEFILLPNAYRCSLDIWKIPTTPETAPKCPLRILGLPSVGRLIVRFRCRGEPNPAPYGHSYSSKPFHDSSSNALVIFTIRTQLLGTAFSMIVHRRTLLALCAGTPDLEAPRTTQEELIAGVDVLVEYLFAPHVPWSHWGPKNTRWFSTDSIVTRWITTSAGQRCVISFDDHEAEEEEAEEPQQQPRRPPSILDFNPLIVERRLLEDDFGPTESLCMEPSKLDDDSFLEVVESQLPFARLNLPWDMEGLEGFEGVMMDDERLLVLKTDESNKIVEIEVIHMGS